MNNKIKPNNGGAGKNRAEAVTILTRTAIQLLNAHGNVKFVGEDSLRFVAIIAGVTIQISPPLDWGLKPSSQMKWLVAALYDHRILPFQLDIWAPDKVLNVEWNIDRFGITSFHRGPWEQLLLSKSAKLKSAINAFSYLGPSFGTVH